jgi:hypothetical protein
VYREWKVEDGEMEEVGVNRRVRQSAECRQRCRKTSRLGLEAGCLGRLAELDLDPPIIDLKRSNQNNLGVLYFSCFLNEAAK